jgi:chemotaxis protein CheX
MGRILLIDCSPEVAKLATMLLGEGPTIESEPFKDGKPLDDVSMVLLELGKNKEKDVQKIKRLRYACGFSNVPIVGIRCGKDDADDQAYLLAGGTEIFSSDDPPAACRRIIQGYLTPGRQPLQEEKEYIIPFVDSTRKVLNTMAGMNAEFREVYFCNTFRIFGDVSGIIGLTGQAEGTVVITFYWELARKVISQMMKVGHEEINAEVIHDGVGEIINMISGATKKECVGKPYHFELSLPTVVMGSGHQIGHPDNASIAMLLFDLEDSSFALQVSLRPGSPTRC